VWDRDRRCLHDGLGGMVVPPGVASVSILGLVAWVVCVGDFVTPVVWCSHGSRSMVVWEKDLNLWFEVLVFCKIIKKKKNTDALLTPAMHPPKILNCSS
jgi:hypothetical protein